MSHRADPSLKAAVTVRWAGDPLVGASVAIVVANGLRVGAFAVLTRRVLAQHLRGPKSGTGAGGLIQPRDTLGPCGRGPLGVRCKQVTNAMSGNELSDWRRKNVDFVVQRYHCSTC